MKPSERSKVEPFHAMDVLARANAMAARGDSVVSLAVGQPSAPAPLATREAAARATQAGRLSYTDALGRQDLRDAIARHYGDHYGIDVPARRIAVTTGSSAGFALSFLALFDPGDAVLIERPGYPAYRNILGALGLRSVEVARVDARSIEAAARDHAIRGVLLASPANPTGSVVPTARLGEVARTCRDAGIALISDEIYHRLVYGDVADDTALAHSAAAVVINSFSKFYCMTGWRVGWMVLPEELVRPVERVAQSLYISAPEASQIGALHAFDGVDELEAVKAGYARNRDVLLSALPKLGFDLAAPPDGAFYAWADVSSLTNDAMAFAQAMLEEARVAAPPGHDFDPPEGHRRMRFSYAGSADDIDEAVRRLTRWIGVRA